MPRGHGYSCPASNIPKLPYSVPIPGWVQPQMRNMRGTVKPLKNDVRIALVAGKLCVLLDVFPIDEFIR